MPAFRLSADQPQFVPQFSIVAEDSPLRRDHFLFHVGLLRQDSSLRLKDRVEVWHCGPPVLAGAQSLRHIMSRLGRRAIDAVGTFDITSDDQEGISTRLAEIDDEKRPDSHIEHYVSDPHMKPVLDEDGRVLFTKFSCTGFVLECYEFIGIYILDWTDENFPKVDYQTLASAYTAAGVDRLGIKDWPRPIVLPG